MIHNRKQCYDCTVKNAVYRNTPGEQYFTVTMVIHTVTMETVKYCSPGVFSYTAFFTVCNYYLQVNRNGVVSFRGPFTDYRDSRPFPLAGSDVLIAPFWADSTNIEIIGGQIFFRLDNRTLLNEVGSTVNDALIYECDFTPTVLFIATWNRTYFDNSPENVCDDCHTSCNI